MSYRTYKNMKLKKNTSKILTITNNRLPINTSISNTKNSYNSLMTRQTHI